MKNIRNFNFVDKRIMVRCDFNVPIDARGNILDDLRIKQSLPTIKYLIEHQIKEALNLQTPVHVQLLP